MNRSLLIVSLTLTLFACGPAEQQSKPTHAATPVPVDDVARSTEATDPAQPDPFVAVALKPAQVDLTLPFRPAVEVAFRSWQRIDFGKRGAHEWSVAAIDAALYAGAVAQSDSMRLSGTLTAPMTEEDDWTYSAEPADRLDVVDADGSVTSFTFRELETGKESVTSGEDFVSAAHRLELTVKSGGAELSITSIDEGGLLSEALTGTLTKELGACSVEVTAKSTSSSTIVRSGSFDCGAEKATFDETVESSIGLFPGNDVRTEKESFHETWTDGAKAWELKDGVITRSANSHDIVAFGTNGTIYRADGTIAGYLGTDKIPSVDGVVTVGYMQIEGGRFQFATERVRR